MKTAVSIPDPLFAEAEQVAKHLRTSRSKLYATAIAQFLKQHGSREVTEHLNEVYANEKSQLDPVFMHCNFGRSLTRTGEETW